MKEWLTSAELAAAKLPDMPQTRQGVELMIAQRGWRATALARPRAGRGGGYEYHVALLPEAARARLALAEQAQTADQWQEAVARKNALWARFNSLPKARKAVCEERLKVLQRVEQLVDYRGISRTAAISMVTFEAGVQKSAYYEWRKATEGVDAEDWLAALAPSSPSANGEVEQVAECHPEAWAFLKSDFLRPERPAFSACFRRMALAAQKEGWSPVPSERSLRRRLDKEVPKAVQLLAREGKDKAKSLYPAQRRSRSHLHAMQMVNMDGHKLDVFVRVPWSTKPVRMYLIGIQDLFSGKVLSWRLTDAETWEAVRLVIGDMVEQFGIPDDIYLDNGRAFASKWITGQSRTRFRFKIREEDPRGLLTTLGITTHWTTPYAGQSKPIERAWRDLAEAISKHPAVSGAYVGNKPDAKPENYGTRAIPIEEFRTHVAARVEEHNAQSGRRAATCKGRSFDETFAASMAEPTTIVRWPSAAQKALWLLASDVIRTRKGSGEVHFQGNRYWSRELNQHAGRKVTVRFDPDRLHDPVQVYDLDNRLICVAPCIEDAGFDDIDAARLHARTRRDFQKAIAAQKVAHASLSAQQLADIIGRGSKADAKPEPSRPVVTRLATGNLAVAPKMAEAISEDEFSDNFSKALARIGGGASILEFPKGNTAGK